MTALFGLHPIGGLPYFDSGAVALRRIFSHRVLKQYPIQLCNPLMCQVAWSGLQPRKSSCYDVAHVPTTTKEGRGGTGKGKGLFRVQMARIRWEQENVCIGTPKRAWLRLLFGSGVWRRQSRVAKQMVAMPLPFVPAGTDWSGFAFALQRRFRVESNQTKSRSPLFRVELGPPRFQTCLRTGPHAA